MSFTILISKLLNVYDALDLQTFCPDFKTYFTAKPQNLHLIARFIDNEEMNGKLSLLSCSTLWALFFNAEHVKASLRPELLKLLTKADGTLVLDHVLHRARNKVGSIATPTLASEIHRQTVRKMQ